MNLKEAFRYQNKLQALMDEAQSLLGRDSNVTKVQNTYLRKKVMAEAENETTIDISPTEYCEQITDVVGFLLYLLDNIMLKSLHNRSFNKRMKTDSCQIRYTIRHPAF
jgi:hypothetical protein